MPEDPQEVTQEENTNTEADSGKKTETQVFDPSKISDEEFAKVFEDERLWKHNRFKKLNSKAKKAEEYEAKLAEQEEAKLAEQNKWQELAEKRKSDYESLQEQYNSEKINNALRIEAQKQGAVDVDTVLSLINKESIKLTDDGIEGVEESVKTLLEAKPFLVGENNTKLGKGTNPANKENQAPRSFKASELNDVEFYRANEKEIMKAMALGLIEDDLAE